MASFIECLAVIMAACAAIEGGKGLGVHSKNAEQSVVMGHYRALKDRLADFSPDELAAVCDPDPQVINRFMEEHNKQLRVEGPIDAAKLYAGALARAVLPWKIPGETKRFEYKDRKYDAVRHSNNWQLWSCTDSENGSAKPIPVLVMETRNTKQTVMMTLADAHKKLVGFALLKFFMNLKKQERINSFSSVQFPEVSLQHTNDLTWLKGLSFSKGDGEFSLTDVKQQTSLTMDRFGALAQSEAVAYILQRGELLNPQTFMLDAPFYVAIFDERLKRDAGALPLPLFYGYSDQDSWKASSHQGPIEPEIGVVSTKNNAQCALM